MTKAVRIALSLGALIGVSVSVAACGGVPGNAVATVDGTNISKSQFDHWMTVAVKASGQSASTGGVPQPPNFAKCIAAKRAAAKKTKGQPKQTDGQLKSQCRQTYNQLREQVLQLLISNRWIEGEAAKQGVKVSNADVQKSFQQQKKQSFPKDADFQKFLQQSGQTLGDIMGRVKVDLLSNKIRDKVIKGKDKVSDAQIQSYYNKNKSRYAQPEKRALRIVLTKTKPNAQQALKALQSGQSWKKVAKQYSIDAASKNQGGQLPPQAKGTLEQALDAAVFSGKQGKLTGPVKTQFGYYVFQVTKITPASQQSLAQVKSSIKQTLATQNQQNALNNFVKDFQKRWRDKTECSSSFKTSDCKNGPKPTPTPSATAAG